MVGDVVRSSCSISSGCSTSSSSREDTFSDAAAAGSCAGFTNIDFHTEIVLESKLGSGGFGSVSAVGLFKYVGGGMKGAQSGLHWP